MDPAAAVAIALAEGEKDAATLAVAGLIAFTAPRGAQSLPSADFTELVELAQETQLPVLLIGDNDEVGRKAMRKIWGLLKSDHHLDTGDITELAPEGGSLADLPTLDLQALIRLKLSDRDPTWQKPGRNRAMYQEFKCRRPKKTVKIAGNGGEIWGLVPCANAAVCKQCGEWETFLHVERCWRGKPAQMIMVSRFGGPDSSIAETVGLAKVYRAHFEERLRRNADVRQRPKIHSDERQHFMTALRIGDDYQASLAMFLIHLLSDKQLSKERRRAEAAGLGFEVRDVVTRQDIEDAAPKSLTESMQREHTLEERVEAKEKGGIAYEKKTVGDTNVTRTWTSSGWASWWEPESTYAFSDGRELGEGETFSDSSVSSKDWRREFGQEWDSTKTLKDNLVQREEHAFGNAQLWMTPCHGLNLETMYGLARGEGIEALIQEIGDYEGPTALLRDAAEWLVGRGEWRKAYRPVLDAAGWTE